jgi:hypothetical protein
MCATQVHKWGVVKHGILYVCMCVRWCTCACVNRKSSGALHKCGITKHGTLRLCMCVCLYAFMCVCGCVRVGVRVSVCVCARTRKCVSVACSAAGGAALTLREEDNCPAWMTGPHG